MRASIIVAAHNEGDFLWRTIRSCIESIGKLDYEILIADDASEDQSVKEALRRFPQLSVHQHKQRQGASPTKHMGASKSRGEVLVFLDGHCHPEPGAIERLIEDVERLDGQSIVTPTILALDTARWKNKESQVGHGYRLELDTFDCGWLPLASLRKVRRTGREFYESPACIGCALAVHRHLYDDLRGFDPHMRIWGVEDLDFSLKCWLMGHSISHDPKCRIGHRFRKKFDNYDVPVERVLVNKLRMAYKNFTQAVWSEWVERCRNDNSHPLTDHPEGLWACAWELFHLDHASAEQERAYLLARRQHDEFWYAERFALSWPRLGKTETLTSAPASIEMQMAEMGSPSPPPPKVELRIHNGLYDWVENPSWSGGQEITGADKVNKGAVTVANLNDTNGDGTPDLDQVEVAQIGPVGRNEIDLCKLIIAKPDPDQGGNVRLTVRKTGVEQGDIQDHVKVWEQPTKKLAFDLTNGTRAIPTDQLDKTLYVEILRPSNALCDIEFEVEYKGVTDRAKATAVWVEKTARAPWHIRQDLDGFPENPVPGPNQDLPDLTKATVIQFINDNWPNGFIAAAGSRYGN